jgi:hypothetical protein
MSWRAAPHVGEEVGVLAPAVTDLDTASAVVVEVFMIWVGASFDHALPAAIFPGDLTVFGVSVLSTAPARFGITCSQRGASHDRFLAAIAAA